MAAYSIDVFKYWEDTLCHILIYISYCWESSAPDFVSIHNWFDTVRPDNGVNSCRDELFWTKHETLQAFSMISQNWTCDG